MADSSAQPIPSGVTAAPENPRGYVRSPELETQFEQAARTLLEKDGWVNPQGERELRADLALEGGGVKGIGLVGAISTLAEAGYSFRGVAGTSAGAIAAVLVAGLSKAGRPMAELRGCMKDLPFEKFQPAGLSWLGQKNPKGWLADARAGFELLTFKKGLGSGNALGEWLRPILEDLGVTTFSDLRLDPRADIGMSLERSHQYRLVVHTSDISRRELVRLPWDYHLYGREPDAELVVEAVRASMSIPFYFEPVVVSSGEALVPIPSPDGGSVIVKYDPGEETWVDGGMLRNFPINAFDRIDGKEPRWPTIGIKLSSLQRHFPPTKAYRTTYGIARGCLETMLNEWDTYSVDDATAARTIFVDHGNVATTDFKLTEAQKDQLFINGVTAATQFVIEMGELQRVPRSAGEAQALVDDRRWAAELDADHDAAPRAGACATCGAPLAPTPAGVSRHVLRVRDAVRNASEWLRRRPRGDDGAVVHRGRAGVS